MLLLGQSWEAGNHRRMAQEVTEAQIAGLKSYAIPHLQWGPGESQRNRETREVPAGTGNDVPDEGNSKFPNTQLTHDRDVTRKNAMHIRGLSFVCLHSSGTLKYVLQV